MQQANEKNARKRRFFENRLDKRKIVCYNTAVDDRLL
jgi:hypothetical protein